MRKISPMGDHEQTCGSKKRVVSLFIFKAATKKLMETTWFSLLANPIQPKIRGTIWKNVRQIGFLFAEQ